MPGWWVPPSHPPLLALPTRLPRLESDEDEEDSVRMVRPASAQPAEVDEDFEREFAALLLDHQGQRPSAGAGANPAAAGAAPGGGRPGEPPAEGARSGGQGAAPAVAFKVVMRRGGREDRSRELQIPLSAGMAAHLRQKEEREAAEKAELKRLVLQANDRDLQVRAQSGRSKGGGSCCDGPRWRVHVGGSRAREASANAYCHPSACPPPHISTPQEQSEAFKASVVQQRRYYGRGGGSGGGRGGGHAPRL